MAVTLTALSGAGRRRGQRYRPRAEINVTPMVDVMLVLLIVFMITAPLLTVGVPVDLPKTDAHAMNAQSEPLTITVRDDGSVYIQDTPISLGKLVPRLRAIAGNGYEERIFLRADKRADYGDVMKVMARIHAAGFTNIGLVTDPLSQ